jgi:glycosyltransferase involved in cell wall biosynthesis
LRSSGYEVDVVTGMPHYPEWEVWPDYRKRLWMSERINDVPVRRRWHYVPRSQSALHRALYEGTFLASSTSPLLPRPDAIIGVAPTLGGAVQARLMARRYGVPYGVIFQDLSGRAAEQSGISGGGRVARVVRAAEGWAARGAAQVGIITEGFRPYLLGLGVDPRRIRRIRNWTHVGEPTVDREALRRRLGLPLDKTLCLHSGNMGFKQGLENVVECARLALTTDPSLHFVLIGDGNQRQQLEQLVAQYQLTNWTFLPIQPKELFPSVLAAADILLVNQRGSVKDMSLPGKLTAYFASGTPIVAAVSGESEAAIEISESRAGLVVEPDQPAALLDAIQTVAADSDIGGRLGAAGKQWAAERLSARGVLAEYEHFVADILASPARAGRDAMQAASSASDR